MKVQIYKIRNRDSCVSEIVEVKSNTSTDIMTHLVPPFGKPEIILYIGQTHQIKNINCANGAIKGHYNISQKIHFIPNYHFLSVRLQPFGLKQLFNINAAELLNSVLDIENHPIGQVLFEYFESRDQFDVSFLKNFVVLIEKYAIVSISSSTRNFVELASGKEIKSIKDVAFENGIGLRTLQRNFKSEVGLSPKEYLRIKRINAVEQKMSQNASVFEIIADLDFSDQAHYIKDFKQLRSFTPAELLKKKLLLSDQLPPPEIITI